MFKQLGILPLIAMLSAAQTPGFSPIEQEVWNGELRYWDYRSAGKVEEYMSLWHDDFVGWPVRSAQPGGKADIRKSFENDLANGRGGSFTLKLEPLTVRVFGDIGEVFYRARYGWLDRNGKSIEFNFRITHTWKRTPAGWKIIAGMSAGEPAK